MCVCLQSALLVPRETETGRVRAAPLLPALRGGGQSQSGEWAAPWRGEMKLLAWLTSALNQAVKKNRELDEPESTYAILRD